MGIRFRQMFNFFKRRRRPARLDLPPPLPTIRPATIPVGAGAEIDLTDTYHALMRETIRDLVKQEFPDATPKEAAEAERILFAEFEEKENRLRQ